MTLTSSGYKCDVCGQYILGLTEDDLAHPFKLSTFNNLLHGCNICIKIVKELDGGGDWKRLPDGPLRRAYEKLAKNLECKCRTMSNIEAGFPDRGAGMITITKDCPVHKTEADSYFSSKHPETCPSCGASGLHMAWDFDEDCWECNKCKAKVSQNAITKNASNSKPDTVPN